jgi:hypothetical protein
MRVSRWDLNERNRAATIDAEYPVVKPSVNIGAMKKLFFLGITLLVLFEVANVYFITPLPYSQRMRSIDVAYALHS